MNQASQRIQDAINDNRRNLDLSSLKLKSLPSLFLEVAPQLEVLTLAKNKFVKFPRELSACLNLNVLILDDNPLRDLYGLSSLQRVHNLSINNNHLTYFPTDILELKRLEVLWMNGNQITAIPQGILELKKLVSLSLTDNKIELLPAEIAQLDKLVNVHLVGNPLKTPPIEVAMRGIHSIRGYFEDLTNIDDQGGVNYLLSVAIDHYSTADFSPQEGRVDDARMLKNVLSEKYNYQPVELYDDDATALNIRSKLNQLAEDTTDRDSVIIYFNSQVSDAFGYGLFAYDMEQVEDKILYSAISKMSAQHVLIIIDFHFYSDQGTTIRSSSLEKETYNSRWIMHRDGHEWNERFTPQLVDYLRNLRFEVGVQELYRTISGVVINPLNLGGDEGGVFNFIPSSLKTTGTSPDEQTAPSINTDLILSNYRQHLASGTIDELFGKLQDDLDIKSQKYNYVISLNSRFNSLQRESLNGIISQQQYDLEQNRINHALQNYIKDLGPEDFKEQTYNNVILDESLKIAASSQAYKEITEKISFIDQLRKSYLDTSSLKKKSTFLQEIDQELEALDKLRTTAGISSKANDEFNQSTNFLEEEKLWQNALSKNSIEAYQQYLDESEDGTYRQEAMSVLRNLKLEQEENTLYEKIVSTEDRNHIDLYRSTFPEGKYISEVESLVQRLEKEEEILWEETINKNTISSYEHYIDNSKIRLHEKDAHIRKHRLKDEGAATRINEAKLIFVGNGRVGKTSLTRRLLSDEFDPDEKSTHGIRIKKWPLTLTDGRTVQVNVWDFGGQEIYHNTHRFFLTNRALYILVWDLESQIDAEDHPEKEENFIFDYWLENVSGLSEESPVLVVQNKIEEIRDRGFDLSNLKQNGGWNVKETLAVSAANNWKIDELRNSICEQLQHAPKLKNLIGYDLGPGWSAVRAELERLADSQPYLQFDQYLDICKSKEVSEENALDLSRFLTDIGIIIHFTDNEILKEMVILDPQWTTQIIYRLLNEKIKKNQGRFNKSELSINMKKGESEQFSKDFRFRDDREVQLFLELMSKFEICFELSAEQDTYIVPQFLSEAVPPHDWDSQRAIRYGYEYKPFHQAIIARAIVKLHEHALENIWWRNGIIIEKNKTKVKIEANAKSNQICIEMIGEESDKFREYILNDAFTEINKQEKPRTVRYCSCSTCDQTFDEALILKLDNEGEETIFCEQCQCNVNIADILGRNTIDMDKKKIFISYSHEDEDYKNTLQTWLKTLQYSLDLSVWNDREINFGSDWDKDISKAMESADYIILMLSSDFFASDFIRDNEIKRAFEREKNKEAVIMPIVVRPCGWELTPISAIQLSPKNGKPITEHDNQDSAWKEVLLYIKKRIDADNKVSD